MSLASNDDMMINAISFQVIYVNNMEEVLCGSERELYVRRR